MDATPATAPSGTGTAPPADDPGVAEMLEATEDLRNLDLQEQRIMYSKLRTQRERTTFAVMMKMTSEALNNVRKEYFMREDDVDLHEFVYIIQKHLSGRGPPKPGTEDERFDFSSKEKQEFALNVYELFNEIDVNGDGGCEWMEFTQFVVEKASFLNKKLKVTNVPSYFESTSLLDPNSQVRHRHEMTKMVDMASLGQIAVSEEQINRIFVLDARTGAYIENHKGDIKTEASPVAMAFVEEPTTVLVASLANMTIATYSVDDPNVVRNYSTLSTFATPGVQMALTYMPKTKLVYSGATNGNVYAWDVKERRIRETLSGHTDIVMSLVTLAKLNYVASGSFDKTVSIWDAYTNQQLLKLYGHKKGIVSMDYAPDHRLLVSAGFEHDACMWSPFVSSCVFRLKGHHAPLVGCQAVKDAPEIITADENGIIKIWDIRNFQCVQSFAANISGRGAKVKDGSKLGAFVHVNVPSKNNYGPKKQEDTRIYVASKLICSYDQAKEETSPTTDAYGVIWLDWCEASLTIITVSERNVAVWDTILGSKKNVVSNICGSEVTAVCLDGSRKRKTIVGDMRGVIGVYNTNSGVLMKQCPVDVEALVVALRYIDEPRHFLAGYQDGTIRLYDEGGLDQCTLIISFDPQHYHRELLLAVFNEMDETLTTVGHAEGSFRMWDAKSGKCEASFDICGTYDHIVQIEYLSPHSALAVSDSTGNVSIFTYTKGAKWTEKRASGFYNQTPTLAEPEEITALQPLDGEDEEHVFSRALLTVNPEEDVAVVELSERSQAKQTLSVSKRQPSFRSPGEDDEDDLEMFEETEDMIDALNFLERKATEDAVKKDIKDSEQKWGKATAAQALAFDSENMVLYTGDTMGNLRSFDLHDVINDAVARRGSTSTSGAKPKMHHPRSAIPPLPQKDVHYTMGTKADATTYLGVKFNWAVEAHEACMLFIRVAPAGVVTSATDCLCRMWSKEGLYLGVLIESVPEGVQSGQWRFEVDVQESIQKEKELVSEIIENVQALVHDTDKPELDSFDFYGLHPGEVAPEFTQSDLRQRIKESSDILGVDFDFVGEPEHSVLGSDFDQKSFQSLTEVSIGKRPEGTATGTAPAAAASFAPGASVRSGVSTAKGAGETAPAATKGFVTALQELRSSDPADRLEDNGKHHHMSEIERRRKALKIEKLARLYEQRGGVMIGKFYDVSNEVTEVSRELDGAGVSYVPSARGQKKNTNQKQIKGGMIYEVENEHDIGVTQFLEEVQDPMVTDRKEREAAANDDMYRPRSNKSVRVDTSTARSHTGRSTGRLGGTLPAAPPKAAVSAHQAAKLAYAGQRNQQVFEACKRFNTFSSLEDTLALADTRKTRKLTAEEKEKLEKQREERQERWLEAKNQAAAAASPSRKSGKSTRSTGSASASHTSRSPRRQPSGDGGNGDGEADQPRSRQASHSDLVAVAEQGTGHVDAEGGGSLSRLPSAGNVVSFDDAAVDDGGDAV